MTRNISLRITERLPRVEVAPLSSDFRAETWISFPGPVDFFLFLVFPLAMDHLDPGVAHHQILSPIHLAARVYCDATVYQGK